MTTSDIYTELDVYDPSKSDSGTEHTRSGKDANFGLVLKFRSHAEEPDAIPIFTNGEHIDGTVEISPGKATSLKAISVELKGFLYNLDSKKACAFLEVLDIVWPGSASKAGIIDAGKHRWDFSLRFPTRTSELSKDTGTYLLPPAFSDSRSPERIVYEMTVIVNKGIFSSDFRMSVPIIYSLQTMAKQSHPAVEAAYARSKLPPSPNLYPKAWWTTLAEMTGMRHNTTFFVFSLTSPRQYARGRCIHAHLSLDVSDLEELDFFTPDFLSLALTRHQVNYTYAKSGERHERDVKDVVARGRVWPAGGKYRAGQKAFWAQILVPQELAVGFTIPTLSLHYTIDVGVSVVGGGTSSLLHIPVTITSHAFAMPH